MVRFKIDVIKALKDAGYTSYQVKQNNYIGGMAFSRMRNGSIDISMETLNRICNLTGLQPGDILEWIPTEEESERAAEHHIIYLSIIFKNLRKNSPSLVWGMNCDYVSMLQIRR